MEIADDGIGGATTGRGSGLRGLADRIAALGGQLTIESPAGQGTRLAAQLPLQQPINPSDDPAHDRSAPAQHQTQSPSTLVPTHTTAVMSTRRRP